MAAATLTGAIAHRQFHDDGWCCMRASTRVVNASRPRPRSSRARLRRLPCRCRFRASSSRFRFLLRQSLLDHPARFRDAPLHRADRHAEDEANLRVAVFARSGEQQRVSQLAGQRRDQSPDRRCSSAAANTRFLRSLVSGHLLDPVVRSASESAGVTVSRSHRPTLLRRSRALRQVIASSQVRNAASPRKLPIFRYARTNASCATSSASASTAWRQRRAIDRRPVPLDQLAERGGVPCLARATRSASVSTRQ